MIALLALSTFTLDCAVAQGEKGPVVSEAWLKTQVRWANTLFAPHGQAFALRRSALAAKHADLKVRRDRDALGPLTKGRVINCFIVKSLIDVHTPPLPRQGVHWRGKRKGKRVHYVIVAANAGPTVLAHELGHFFGNRKHPKTPGNIMSYNRVGRDPFFDAKQGRTIRRFSARFRGSGELRVFKAAKRGAPTHR